MLTIVDADSLIFFSLPKKDSNSTFEDCLNELNNRINDILFKTKADKYILCLTEGKCFRYKKWKYANDYKSSRRDNVLHPFYYSLKEYMKQNYATVSVKELEADDLVSIYAYECREDYTIASIDKDVLGQIPGIHYNYRTAEFQETRVEDIEYNIFRQVLTGDAVDSVYGIQGIGIKTADKLFSKRQDYYHIVLEQYVKRYGVYEGINRFYENYSLIYMLKSFEEVRKEVGLELKLPNYGEVEQSGRNW